MKTINRMVLSCKRCGHDWIRRSVTELPKQCPKCRSPYWDIERRHTIKIVEM